MRFAFGQNWRSFLGVLDQRRIDEAVRAIQASLGVESLEGRRVLDIGSGSGLSSLAMHRMGAQVVSFDYDPDSVACTEELRRRFAAPGADWKVMQGSVLDPEFMAGLGTYDLVYAWGVLHHTGAMWDAIEQARRRVAPGGTLLLALYNDQGWRSRAWWHIKRLYCSGGAGRWLVTAAFYPLFALYTFYRDLREGHAPGTHMREYARNRGMSILHDWRDWLGGFPFEVASSKAVADALASDFDMVGCKSTRGWGCNELVLRHRTG